ncbi:MAG: hypothetical protein II707_11295, partial [Spirochaetales bacterium]|nr:hypothetical protein [Spirochaetales bacterium]
MKKLFSFIIIITFCLVGCPSDYAPECGQTKSEPSPDTTVSYSFTEPYFSSTAYQLDATTDAPDGVEFTLTVNDHSVTAKSFGGLVTFDLSKCFTEYDKGGIDYDAKVSAANANIKGGSNFKISYWPVVSCKLYCDDEMIIYNGSAKNFESPSFTVNYDKESYNLTMTYTVLDTDGTTDITPSDAEDWKLSNMLAFLQKVENDGKSVVVHICIMPVRNDIDQMVLAYEHDVKYICSKDVKVNSVVARGVLPDNRYDAILFAETGITPDSNILMRDTAGGEIVYAWEISENGTDWTKISGADKKTYIMNKSDLGKYLRVTIEQTFEGHKQSPIISNVIEPLQNYFSQTVLFYDDVVLVGNRPDETKIMAFALDAFEKAIYDITFSFPNEIEDLYYLQYSQDILVQLDKEGFKTGYNLVFVTVQHNLLQTELPTLSTDIQHISVGYAKWLENDDTLEYSLNGGMSYQTVTTEPFETSAGTAIYIRKKSVGTPNKKGYIKESSARSISVTGSHIGRWTGEFSFEQPTLFSTAYILEADTNAFDGTEFTVTLKE